MTIYFIKNRITQKYLAIFDDIPTTDEWELARDFYSKNKAEEAIVKYNLGDEFFIDSINIPEP